MERIWKEFGKKAGLMVFIMIVFLAIPIVTTSAQNAMKGDPVIICVSSELIRAKERTARTEDASFGDIIFHLDVQLKAVKHFTSTANATLRFKDIASLAVEQTMTGEKNEPKILRSQTTWNAMRRGKTQSALQPFAITGFQRLPERIAFELDVSYTNPNDGIIYFTTLSIIPWIPDTTIDITYISNPPNKPKGDSVPIVITVKNIGSEVAIGLVVHTRVKSIRAGTPGDYTAPFSNTAGSIVLHSSRIVRGFFDFIVPQQQITFTYSLPCHGFSNGAMNVGDWKIIQVGAYAYNSPIDIVYENDPMISDPGFSVDKKVQSAGPHALFIYYLWNSGGAGGTWAGDNPKNYFVNGYGSVKAGLWRFSQTSSNIPVLINPIIAWDDRTWSIPANLHDTGTIMSNGVNHIEDKLKISSWSKLLDSSCHKQCGFDIILLAAGRRGNVAGIADKNVALVCKWRRGLPSLSPFWQSNIDGTVQHEVSHLFGTKDVPGHARVACIMAYWETCIWRPDWYRSYLYEYMWGEPCQTNNWHSACRCQIDFLAHWDRVYDIC